MKRRLLFDSLRVVLSHALVTLRHIVISSLRYEMGLCLCDQLHLHVCILALLLSELSDKTSDVL